VADGVLLEAEDILARVLLERSLTGGDVREMVQKGGAESEDVMCSRASGS
jgi:hypothetical protein